MKKHPIVILLVTAFLTISNVNAKPVVHSKHKSISSNSVGIASWYGYESGPSYRRQPITANGEKFSPHKLTAAHRTFPFGTKVNVTNLSNKKSVIVTINDRGPFVRNRIIDLSKAAAESINIRGIQRVSLRPLTSKKG